MRATRRQILGLAAAAPVLFTSAGQAAATTHNVLIKGRKFTPANLTINAGDTISFSNAAGTHTATALDGSFDTGTLKKGASAEVTLTTKGTFPYHCRFHRSMKGTITVG